MARKTGVKAAGDAYIMFHDGGMTALQRIAARRLFCSSRREM